MAARSVVRTMSNAVTACRAVSVGAYRKNGNACVVYHSPRPVLSGLRSLLQSWQCDGATTAVNDSKQARC